MKPFEIFRAGTQTSSNGTTMDFSEDMLRASVEAYDPAVGEAPIVIGHPKDNHPAFGWIKSLSYADGLITAHPDQVDAEFAEEVAKGRYKKRSASFYLPDHPNNPKPGTLYLRHVGFLGAMPPSVKGLKGVEFQEAIQERGLRAVAFAEGEEGIVEFGEVSPYTFGIIGSALRGLRDWIIGEKGLEMADKVLPSYYIDELNSEAERQRAAQSQVADAVPATPSFAEPNNQRTEDTGMLTPEQIKALQDENAALKADAAKNADFAEKENAIAAREAALLKKEIAGKVDELIAAGKVLPAHKDQVTDFMASLQDADTVVEFGEGDKVEKFSQRAFFEKFLSELPQAVDFSERSKDDKANPDFDVKKAEQKIADQVASGGNASA